MVSFEINGHRWSKVPDAASCWTLTTAVAACIWVMRALMSVKHSVLDLTSFKRCLFNIPSCSYCFHIDDPTKTVFVSEISGAGVSCRAGLTAWKRRRRSIHVGLLEKVGWAEGQWEWEREREEDVRSRVQQGSFFARPRTNPDPMNGRRNRWDGGRGGRAEKGRRLELCCSDVSQPTSSSPRYHWSVVSQFL